MYKKNLGKNFTLRDQKILNNQIVTVIGCGGNGGYIIEFLARLGVKKLILFDGDNFELSNINRQIGATQFTLGQNKAKVMADLVKKINPHIEVVYYKKYFNKQDIKKVIKSNFIFFECDDSININEVRNILRNIILKYNIPVFDGGIYEDGGSCAIITPENIDLYDIGTYHWLKVDNNIDTSQFAHLCAIIAGYKINNYIKYICNKDNQLNNSWLIINTEKNEITKL